jgi:uncharacterized protein YbaA (DUF1428 family)
MSYIDGFVASARDREAYLAFAARAAPLLKDSGALRVVEGWGVDVPHGEQTDLYRAVAAEEGESVIFSWIEWPDKATRDAGWATVMAAMPGPSDAPFNMKRMIFGGFEAILDQ